MKGGERGPLVTHQYLQRIKQFSHCRGQQWPTYHHFWWFYVFFLHLLTYSVMLPEIVYLKQIVWHHGDLPTVIGLTMSSVGLFRGKTNWHIRYTALGSCELVAHANFKSKNIHDVKHFVLNKLFLATLYCMWANEGKRHKTIKNGE